MLDSKYRGRRKGVPIREGSVRQARAEARLSLGQIAGDSVSRAAIHHIENGRVKPSMETLQLIARQTRKPLDFFLLGPSSAGQAIDQQGALHQLEALSSLRDFEAVVHLGLPMLEKPLGDHDRAYLGYYLGQAYCRLVRPSEALQLLPAARRHFEQSGDEWMAVEALDWESAALGLIEDPRAMGLAFEALERCQNLDPRPFQTEARILGHVANLHVVAQSWAQAVRYYEAAVEAAGDVKDLLQQAKMHHGLGIAYSRMSSPTKAREHFDRALALYSIESDPSATYRVENDLGYLLLREGHLDSAEAHLTNALSAFDELHIDRRGRGYVLNSLAELSLRRDRPHEAREYLSQALQSAHATDEGIVKAGSHALLGELEERQGNAAQADQEFDFALAVLAELDMPDRLREMHMQYANLLEARHDIGAAAFHWKQAAELGKSTSTGLRWADLPAEEVASS